MSILAFYIPLIVLSAVAAWYLWGFPAVRRLDARVLGERGLAVVASVAAALFIAGASVALVQHAWGVALAYGVLSGWTAYWAYRRVNRLRQLAH